jgi:hypothetical protein
MVEAQGCPGLMGKAVERWFMEKSPCSGHCWRPGCNISSIWVKGLDGKVPGKK